MQVIMISYPVERQVDILEFAVQFLYSISPPNHDYFPLHNDDGTAAMSVAGIVFFSMNRLISPPLLIVYLRFDDRDNISKA